MLLKETRHYTAISNSVTLHSSVTCSGVLRGGVGGGGGFGEFKQPPPPQKKNSKGPPKSWQTQPECENCKKLLNLGSQHPKMFRKKDGKILKLPPVSNSFTLAMTNKLVVITNSLKVPKIKKILLYEMKFLVSNYSCLQNPWLGGYCPQIPLLSVLNWICWTPPERNSWVRHWFSRNV